MSLKVEFQSTFNKKNLILRQTMQKPEKFLECPKLVPKGTRSRYWD